LHPAPPPKFFMQAHFPCTLRALACRPMQAPARASRRLHAKTPLSTCIRRCMKLPAQIFACLRLRRIV
jgi:hypothetical protein